MTRFLAITRFRATVLTAATMFVTGNSSANAHPGHGAPSAPSGLLHYVTSPVHAGPVVLAVVIAAAGVWLLARRRDEESDR